MILFYYSRIKKVESQGEKCHTRTMIHSKIHSKPPSKSIKLSKWTHIMCLQEEFIFIRIKKDNGEGKERCHVKPMMSNEVNDYSVDSVYLKILLYEQVRE